MKPVGKVIPEEILERSYRLNKDGYGYVALKDGQHDHFKTLILADFKEKVNQYNNEESFLIMHCRLSTGGGISTENAHPFHMPKNDLYLFHNGKIKGFANDTCDSLEFAKMLDDTVNSMDEISGYEELFSLYNESRLLVCDKQGNYVIINEKVGEWKDGIWYSKSNVLKDPVANTSCYNEYGSGIYVSHTPKRDIYFLCSLPLSHKEIKKHIKGAKFLGCGVSETDKSVLVNTKEGHSILRWAVNISIDEEKIEGGRYYGVLYKGIKDIDGLRQKIVNHYKKFGYETVHIYNLDVVTANETFKASTIGFAIPSSIGSFEPLFAKGKVQHLKIDRRIVSMSENAYQKILKELV